MSDKTYGIDISHYQPVIDWRQVVAIGMKFVFLKASDGLSSHDTKFAQHRKNAHAAGMIVGAYHFYHPKADPIAQADNLLNAVGAILPNELPLTLDIEWADGLQQLGTCADNALKLLDHLENATGLVPIIYTSKPFFAGFPHPERFAKYPCWLAAYNPVGPKVPAPWTNYTFWQYSDHEAIGGVGKIDGNVFNGSLEQLQAMTKK